MKGLRQYWFLVVVVVFVVSAIVGSASAVCVEEYFYVFCGVQCDYLGQGIWLCNTPNPDRCCYELIGEFRCGEGAIDYCPECQPGGCGF